MMVRQSILALAAAIILQGCGDSGTAVDNTANIASVETADADQIKPESIVSFPKGEIACLDKDSLEKMIDYASSGSKTKMNALMVGNGGDCAMLSPDRHFKVIGAEYNDPQMPEAGILEVVGEKIAASDKGAFVLLLDKSLVAVVKKPE